jgi:hypothetical protein
MPPRPVHRKLSLKRIHYATRRKDFQRPKIEDLLQKAVDKAPTLQDRHYQPQDEPTGDSACCFLRRHVKKPAGFVFELCTYQPGHIPMHAIIDLAAQDVDIDAYPIEDRKTGRAREIITTTSVLALGDALIIEIAKGSGGIALLAEYLTNLVRTHAKQDCLPIRLKDVANRSLKDQLKRGGGVGEVILNL